MTIHWEDVPTVEQKSTLIFNLHLLAIASPMVFSIAWLMSSCAPSGNDPRLLEPLPADWKQAAAFPRVSPQADLSRWWKKFDDPVLTDLIQRALAKNPDIASASARIREARARRAVTNAGLFPVIDADLTNARRYNRMAGEAGESNSNATAGLDASWEVDWFGKQRSELLASDADLESARENSHSVQAALAAEIATAYTLLRADEERLTILRKTISTRQETQQLAAWRTEAGEADALDAKQALSSLEQAKASIPSLQQQIQQSHNFLNRLVGEFPGSLDGRISSSRGIPRPSRSLAVALPAETVRQRPDVRLAGHQLIAAAARSQSARAEQYPSLRLSGSLGIQSLGPQKWFDPQSTAANLLGGISSPIFDAGRIRSNIKARDAIEEQAWQNYRSKVLLALSETEDALIACQRTDQRIGRLKIATEAARDAERIARQRYETGLVDYLSVLETQRNLLALEDNFLSAQAALTQAYIQLYKALGGGWSRSS